MPRCGAYAVGDAFKHVGQIDRIDSQRGLLAVPCWVGFWGRFPVTMIVLHMKEHIRFWTVSDFMEWVRAFGGEVVDIHGQYGHHGLLWKRWPELFAWGLVYVIEPRQKGAAPFQAAGTLKDDRTKEEMP